MAMRNHRAFEARMQEALNQPWRHLPMALLLLEHDEFESLYGHAHDAGGDLLREVTRRLQQTCVDEVW